MKNTDILILSVVTFITVMAWIALDVYHVAVTSTLTEAQQKLIIPLNPKFDERIFREIELRSQ